MLSRQKIGQLAWSRSGKPLEVWWNVPFGPTPTMGMQPNFSQGTRLFLDGNDLVFLMEVKSGMYGEFMSRKGPVIIMFDTLQDFG